MPNQWEDDDDFYDGEEEETTDMGDEPPVPVVAKPPVEPGRFPIVEHRSDHKTEHRQKKPNEGSKGKRTVRVRPMPPSMQAKYPDVVSMLLTLGSGKQVMFVKGG